MRIRSKLLVSLGVALAAAGCDAFTAPGAINPAAEAPAGANAAEAELRLVSKALATALNRQNVRVAVRDAMRDSPWDVHQISLREYLDSPAGGVLLAAAARAAGEAPAAFAARVRALPDLDFYVPSREQRKMWTGAGSVVLAAALDPEDGQVFGFGPDGRSVAEPLGAGGAGHTVMLLHPAESRGRRNQPQPAGVGGVIQTARDGEQAVRLRWIGADGTETELPVPEVAPTRSGAGPRFGSATVHGDSTYLDYLSINFTDPGDDAEITVYAKFYAPDGSYLGEYRYDNYSVYWNTDIYPHAPLSLRTIPDSSNAYFEVKVREDDSDVFNADDWFGPRNYTWVDRAQTRSLQTSNDIVNIELDWNRRAAPVYTTLALGDVSVFEGDWATAVARRVDQYGYTMPGSFTVSSWSISNLVVATLGTASGTDVVVNGENAGNTSITASYGGKTGTAGVEVTQQCVPEPPALVC
jgi:hypothetical protein